MFWADVVDSMFTSGSNTYLNGGVTSQVTQLFFPSLKESRWKKAKDYSSLGEQSTVHHRNSSLEFAGEATITTANNQ